MKAHDTKCIEESTALHQAKVERIRKSLAGESVDLWTLRELALTRGGLVNAEARRIAWPVLVDVDRIDHARLQQSPLSLDEKELELIRLDAKRSVLFRYCKPRGSSGSMIDAEDGDTTLLPSGESSAQRELSYSDQQNWLSQILTSALTSRKGLHYYQGLHDIAGVLLYNLQSTADASAILQRLLQWHLRDATRSDLSSLKWLLDTVLFPLLKKVDVELHDFLLDCELEGSNTILPWIITWFAHDIHDEQVASRFMDAFVASHALFPLYVAVAILVHPRHRQDILETDCDPASVHVTMRSLLSGISNDWAPPGTVACQTLIDDALSIMREMPPRSLLALAGAYTGDDTRTFTRRAAYVSLLRAPPSWALAATIPQVQWCQWQEKNKDSEVSTANRSNDECQLAEVTIHAKCASGVPFVMPAVEETTILSKRLDTMSQLSPTSHISSRWELCQHILFGNFCTEDCYSWPVSAPSERKSCL